jgi:hypothetical protein
MSVFHQIGPPYEGKLLSTTIAECVAITCLPWVDGGFDERWEEASKEERGAYVEARRRCNCCRCQRWRRDHGGSVR